VPPTRDLYEILGVKRNATDKEIKAAYRRLARKFHPDVNPNDPAAEQRFKEIQAAYSVLGDREKRAQYDSYGSSYFSRGAGPASGPGMEWEEFVRTFANRGIRVDFGEGNGFDLLGDLLGHSSTTQTRRDTRPRRGTDIYQPVTIGFLEAANGTAVTLELTREVTCERCNGSGAEPDSETRTCPSCGGAGQVMRGMAFLKQSAPCPQCHGEGSVAVRTCMRCRGSGTTPKTERIEVRVPPGVDTGSKVRVPGKGRPGRNGGPYGDLLLNVTVRPHPYFQRKDCNALLEVPITVDEALLGAKIEIPTLAKRVKMKIPAGTDSGTEFRLRGKGFPRLSGSGCGDLLVRVRIVSPKAMNVRSRELIREFAKENPSNPRLRLFGF